jgi:hypothetical protein
MHGKASIILKSEALSKVYVLLDLLQWLATNPFGYRIPPIARDNTASLEFSIFERVGSTDKAAGDIDTKDEDVPCGD